MKLFNFDAVCGTLSPSERGRFMYAKASELLKNIRLQALLIILKARKLSVCFLPFAAFLLSLPSPNAVADNAGSMKQFQKCLSRLENTAIENGVSSQTVKSMLESIQWLEGVIRADRSQPEFHLTFWHYLESRVTDARIERGREMYHAHYSLLHKIYLRYGIPPQYLVALWGMETNYGSNFGSVPLMSALTTLACDQRRSNMFTREFINALLIQENGAMDLTRSKGSWAGAIGHMQFLPSTCLKHAVDSDKDGRIDLFGSLPDAFASAANYLHRSGWKKGKRWGREVLIPLNFNYVLAGLGTNKSVNEWRALGLVDASGEPLPESDIEGSLLLPMGHNGPAFLVYRNFHIIRKWNASISFALTVGHLADRIAGMDGLTTKCPDRLRPLSTAEVREIQEWLNRLGYESGEADGLVGRRTRAAARAFQAEAGLPADGYLTHELMEMLQHPERKRAF